MRRVLQVCWLFAGAWGILGCLCDGVCWSGVVGGDSELEAEQAAAGDLL